MGNSLRTCYVELKGLDTAGRAKVEELIQRATPIFSYDKRSDVYSVTTDLTLEEFRALPWPDGCAIRDQ